MGFTKIKNLRGVSQQEIVKLICSIGYRKGILILEACLLATFGHSWHKLMPRKWVLLALVKKASKGSTENNRLLYERLKQLLHKNPTCKQLILARYNLEGTLSIPNQRATAQEYFNVHKTETHIQEYELIDSMVYLGALGNHHLLTSLIQSMELGYRRKKNLVVRISKRDRLRNKTLFRYFEQYLTVQPIENGNKTIRSQKKTCATIPFLGMYIDINEKMTQFEVADSFLQKKWYESGRGPLLSLSDSDRELGRRYLVKMGIPENSWYVCFHLREPGYRDGGSKREDFRNVDPKSYYSAMKEVTDRGGYVFRMGDPSMTPLPKMERVVDYAHSEEKGDFLDVFLCATCEFIVGTSSGVYNISRFFGVPVLMTNLAGYLTLYSMPVNCIYIPRLLKSNKTGSLLTMEKIFRPNINNHPSSYLYKSLALSVVDNTEEDLVFGVREMADKRYLTENFTTQQTSHQEIIDDISYRASSSYGGINTEIVAKISPSFISKHHKDLFAE